MKFFLSAVRCLHNVRRWYFVERYKSSSPRQKARTIFNHQRAWENLAGKVNFIARSRKQMALPVLLAVRVYYVEWTLNVEACFRHGGSAITFEWVEEEEGELGLEMKFGFGFGKELNSCGRAPSLRLRIRQVFQHTSLNFRYFTDPRLTFRCWPTVPETSNRLTKSRRPRVETRSILRTKEREETVSLPRYLFWAEVSR